MLFLSSCVSFNIDKVKPSGNIVKEEYQMEPFNEVDLDLMGNVKIVQGKGDDYRVVKVEITDSLEANKEPDESISFYEPSLYTLTRLMNYQKFHPQGYSPRLTIYFYAAAALFFLMLIFWLIKSFIVSPFKKKTV